MNSDTYQCAHVLVDGSICGSPSLSDSNLCYRHHKARARRRRRGEIAGPLSNPGIDLPTLEDAASVQVAIQEITHAIIDRRIDDKRASLLLYAMQLASNNARYLESGPVEGSIGNLADDIDEVGEDEVDFTADEEEASENEDDSKPSKPDDEGDEKDSDDHEAEDSGENGFTDEERDDDDKRPVELPESAPSLPPKKKPGVDYEALERLKKRLIAAGLCASSKPDAP